tara:strand:- start:946 stop:1179 length:234 start_codon:yes stop_codon:yes gene_type:complete
VSIKQFGQSKVEAKLQDKIKAREIVQSVLEYGINENQKMQIIYLFALELENTELMKNITQQVNQSQKGASSSIITGE